MKTETKKNIGFILEVMSFTLVGYELAYRNYFIVSLLLVIAFFFAIYTGKKIKKETLEAYGK
jgi:hypothetical protein